MFETSSSQNPHWETETLKKVLLEHITEQRRARRWNIFFRLVFITFLGLLFYMGFMRGARQPVITAQPHTALIDIKGEIGEGEESDADNIRDALKAAFENRQVRGVILRINSPGGSAVQSRQVYNEIRTLRNKYPEILIYSTIEDIGASGAYLIAAATDAIYADKTSIVGSIGAKISSFGFVEAIHKVGVERRLYVAGKYKGMLDPFLPRDLATDEGIHEMLRTVHQAFIDNVKEGRGNRLKNAPDLFSGLCWSGEQAFNLGLTDGYGDAQFVAKEIIQNENLVDYTPSRNLLDKLARRIGASMATTLSGYFGLMGTGIR